MSWTTLATTGDHLRRKEPVLFEDLDDSTLLNLKATQAKYDVLLDICGALGIDYDGAEIDEISTLHTAFLQEVLAVRQLYWYFVENDMGEGTVQRQRLETYRSMYEKLKSGFTRLRDTTLTRTITRPISR